MYAQQVLDLCWVVNSPSLIDGSAVATCAPLDPAHVDPEHLAAFLGDEPPPRRVGRYFEQLLHYWLAQVRGVDVVANGLQLRDGKITVGEIDFLYRDDEGALTHCETSVKFFLCAPGHEPSAFPGPNARDNFERKVAKLFDKQLRASEGRVEGIDRREGLIKGMIFYRSDGVVAARPDRLADGHLRGTWCRAHEIAQLGAFGERYAVVEKPFWLAPVATAPVLSIAGLERRLAVHFAGPAHPLMLSVRSATDPTTECQRVIVVDTAWPDVGEPAR